MSASSPPSKYSQNVSPISLPLPPITSEELSIVAEAPSAQSPISPMKVSTPSDTESKLKPDDNEKVQNAFRHIGFHKATKLTNTLQGMHIGLFALTRYIYE